MFLPLTLKYKYETTLNFRNLYFNVKGRNNFGVPVKVTIYWLAYKIGSNSLASAVLAAASSREGITDFTTNSLVFPSDFSGMRQNFNLIRADKATLQPGDEMSSTYTKAVENIRPKEDAWSYAPGSITALVRIEGGFAYDAATPTTSLQSDCQISLSTERNFDFKYTGDIKMRKIQTTHAGGDLTPNMRSATVEVVTKDEL